ncbi:MAG: hypothetical protein LBF81_02000 [Prevotellaceae bacterium]|jgi:hypothetical protein|nr:hypothetical protein [Prevotellaceae bacterium]
MKKHVIRTALGLSLSLFLFISCEKENPKETPTTTPTITFTGVDETGEQKVKIGGTVTLNAIVENAVNPIFTWKIGGKIVSTERTFTFVADKLGEYFANFRVDAENGSKEGQVKISVLEKLPPSIKLGATLLAYSGKDTELTAEADNAENATYVWRLDGQVVSETATYIFNQTTLGDYLLTLKVTTADGQDLKTVAVTVLPEPLPELFFDDGHYRTVTNAGDLRKMTVPEGKSLVLAPVICNVSDTVGFEWKVDGTTKQTGENLYYTFTPAAQGTYLVSVTETGTGATAKVEVTCTASEGTNKRTGGAKAHATKAYDYIPAPGQFVSYQAGSTKVGALADLQAWCDRGAQGYFHIGAYGGYFIVGFDHSVENKPDAADLQINGNAFSGWCEPGIVWVSQDENGNGLADDTWYELKGSETGQPATTQRLVITYYKPRTANSNVMWTDNIGRSESVDWNGFHMQASYFPMFIVEDYYMLTGTCLASTFFTSGLEYSACYSWGYADNLSSNGSRPGGQFWIEDAIQVDGSPANLQYIDFVKVHTATTGKGAAVGEISCEAYLPVDLNF